MVSSEVQRTLVKSPPELWAEISDPDSLARHLGEFGEIRITRVEPEQRVEWEADDTSGSVVIKPSGWGTKVKLTVKRELEQSDGRSPSTPSRSTGAEQAPARATDGRSQRSPTASTQRVRRRSRPRRRARRRAAAGGRRERSSSTSRDAEPDGRPRRRAGRPSETAHRAARRPPEPSEAGSRERRAGEPRRRPRPQPRRGFFARLFGRRGSARARRRQGRRGGAGGRRGRRRRRRPGRPERDSTACHGRTTRRRVGRRRSSPAPGEDAWRARQRTSHAAPRARPPDASRARSMRRTPDSGESRLSNHRPSACAGRHLGARSRRQKRPPRSRSRPC